MAHMPTNALTRRQAIGALAATGQVLGAAAPQRVVVESHLHLFAGDDPRFPYHPNAPYKPPPLTLETYVKFATEAGLKHAVIVHPEPYQDDHRYLEYCLSHEPSRGFFKGTCLFDPVAPDTPDRMTGLSKRYPGRIVALRIHLTSKPGTPPTTSGAIKDRDMRSAAMQATWKRAQQLGMAIQMHFLPYYAGQIAELAQRFPDVPVVLDHLGRGWQGTPAEFDGVLKLARLRRVYIKYSAVGKDAAPLVRRAYDAFGPDRILWGSLGNNREQFEAQSRQFDAMFEHASESDRAKIRGLNTMKLYRF